MIFLFTFLHFMSFYPTMLFLKTKKSHSNLFY